MKRIVIVTILITVIMILSIYEYSLSAKSCSLYLKSIISSSPHNSPLKKIIILTSQVRKMEMSY